MCLAEEESVWEGSFCQIKCRVAGRSVVHAFSRNAVFFVKLSKNHDFTCRSCSFVNLPRPVPRPPVRPNDHSQTTSSSA
ncbi:hypothetical protein L596_012987 [Steinernema carpocapsae]|uniref:Uncharacterized protein n=1 Tax=Steinernema carpocapsae TaxID=34508 RepID=A0A4U5NZB4_STECR|nr:hypothetical protein L596_012987 [Steinernema carpocapsae]